MSIKNINIFFFLFCTFFFNSISFSQKSSIDKLEKRIADLELRVSKLENQLSNSNNLIPNDESNINYSQKWKNRSLWRKLYTGMSMNEVEDLLGKPRKIDVGYGFTTWYYSEKEYEAYVSFYKGYLERWTEPE